MKYKKTIFISVFISVIYFLISSPVIVYAYENDENISGYIESYFDYSYINPYITEEIKDIFDFENSDIKSISDIRNLNLSELFEYILKSVKDNIQKPFKYLISVFILLTISYFINSINGLSTNRIFFDKICLMANVILIYDLFFHCFEDICNIINRCSEFFMAFVPVFSSTILLSSGTVTASGYSAILLTLSDIIVQITNNCVIPFLYICFALAVCDSVNSFFSFKTIIKHINKIIQICIKLFLSIYSGILSIQTIINSNADGIGNKTVKLLITSSIPIVGSSISEAYGSVKSCINILKSGLGTMAIVILGIYIIPVIIEIIIYRFTFMSASIISEMYGKNDFVDFFNTVEIIFSIAYALLITVFSVFVISIAIVLITSKI